MEADLDEASGSFKLAHDLLNECKAAGNINDLNTAIYLLFQAAYSLLPSHPELAGCLNRLSVGLATRFSYTGDLEDVHLAVIFANAATLGVYGINLQPLFPMNTDPLTVEDVPRDMMELAANIVTHFNQAVDSATLNNCIFLHREALASRVRHPEHWKSLLELSGALLIQFRVAGNMEALQETISLLRELHRIQPNRWASFCAALIMEGNPLKLLEMGNVMQEAMQLDEDARAFMKLGTHFAQTFEQSGNLSDLDTGIAQLRQGHFRLSWGHPAWGGMINNLATALQSRFEQRGEGQDINEAIQLHREALALRPSPHPDRGSSLNNLANAIQTRFEQRGDGQDIDEAIQLHQEALALRPSPHPDRGRSLNNLAGTVQTRFKQRGDAQDIDEAIQLHREALALRPSPHPDRGGSLNNLANAVQTRFEQRGHGQDIDEAIQLHREALALRPSPHPDHGRSLNNLAGAVQTRFKQWGDAQDIDEAIQLHREALALRPSPHPDRGSSLNNLANAVQTRFKQRGDGQDIDEAIQLHREALALRPSPHPDRGGSLNNLANAVQTRFKQRGDGQDIDEAIQLHREALAFHPSPHPDRGGSLNNLANAVRTRFEQRGDGQDIDEAIQLHREALALRPSPHPDRGSSLNNLANVVRTRFEQRGDGQDIDEAIQLHREALALRPSPHPDRGSSLNNLANAVRTQFEQRGDGQDIDEAIQLHREALALRPSPHPDRGSSLNNLANAVRTRFEQRGDGQDIDEAIQLHREALALHPSPHPDRGGSLNNLAGAVQTRFEQRGDAQDIDEAIQLHREALALRPSPHPDRGGSLNNLANAVQIRFEQWGDAQDIDEAIKLHREALALRPSPHPDRGSSLNNLANAVQTRFKQRGDTQDIDEAIHLSEEALMLSPPPNAGCGTFLQNLAILLVHSYECGRDPHHLSDAITLLQEASHHVSSSPLKRFTHTCLLARTAAKHDHPSALPAYRAAINLLPQLAALHLDLRLRQQLLATLNGTGLASDAAACAIGLNEYATAVEFLEASRLVFWSQALHLRTPLNILGTSHPQLASQIFGLAAELEQSSFRMTRRNLSTDRQHEAISIELEGAHCQRLNEDWAQAISSVRMLPGFEDFMQPKGIMALTQAAVYGPVVILNPGQSTSHALLVKHLNDVQCVPLPDISMSSAKWLVKLLRALSGSTFDLAEFVMKNSRGDNTMPRALVEARILAMQEVLDPTSPNEVFRVILALLWELIVKPVLDVLDLMKSANPPRLWWCPVGPLAFLPIHAAGIYDKQNADCISDYVVSSYAPTLAALLDLPTHSDARFKMTAVIQPESKFSPLPETRTELKRIQERVPEQWLTALGDTTPATVATALAHLWESSIVHFACHGTQDEFNPLDSGLVLTDGLLKVSEIMCKPDSSEGNRNSRALAFLSACETAKGDEQVPDEAMHLAATLLFAGFRGVVATMWTMNDLDGPKIADTFYEHLFRDCDLTSNPPVVPDLTEAARALHLAVTKLREDPDIPFMRWVPFVHYGL
ncbi:tetratricopeptide repeat-containing protein [Mycena maculata]|uniref:Tetratricopeptide repeat-containing protein n=1 Tax=Mycena maculata TaxID=230809 RepID=A0AAD7N698_9AGAR|nr:tetratricopeptide repeat-containing protein [Mycena maculata]